MRYTAMNGTQHKRNGARGKKARQERALQRIKHYPAMLSEKLRTQGHGRSQEWKQDIEKEIARYELQISVLRGKLGIEQ